MMDRGTIRAQALELIKKLPFPLADPDPGIIEAALIQAVNETVEAAAKADISDIADGNLLERKITAIRRLRIEDKEPKCPTCSGKPPVAKPCPKCGWEAF